MEFHYPDLCVPSEHLLNGDGYPGDYDPQFLASSQEGEYTLRSSVLVDGGDRFGVSAVAFDKFEELIWMGNQGGHVTSYFGPGMQKYTSFQVHDSEEVRDITTMEKGIFVLTKTTLRHQIRRGIPKHTFRSGNMVDMQCLYQSSSSSLLLGGHQDKLLHLDLNTMLETVIPIPEAGCVVLSGAGGGGGGGGGAVAGGAAGGAVWLRDARAPAAAQLSFRAHSGCLSDMDMQGDLLITCGFSDEESLGAVAEPYVLVWDVRRPPRGRSPPSPLRAVPCSPPPRLLQYVPAFSARAVAAAGGGQVTLLHLNDDRGDGSVFQVETHNSVLSVMDVCASSQALTFGDAGGRLALMSPAGNHDPLFNSFSRETEFSSPSPRLPSVPLTDHTFKFSSVPLPPLATGRWFNELPAVFFKKQYRKPTPVDPLVLGSMKMQGPIGYAPNPNTRKRNEMPYITDPPSEQSPDHPTDSLTAQYIPKHYLKVDPRQQPADGNPSGLPGLEDTHPNSYCNSMIQVLFHTPAVRAALLSHSCTKEFCLTCQLGFLFRSMSSAGGQSRSAGKFLRAFRTVPEAAALGLLLTGHRDRAALVQSWNRFILYHIHYEMLETRKETPPTPHPPPPPPPTDNTRVTSPPNVNGNYECRYSELELLGTGELERGRETGSGEEGAPPQRPVESDISRLFAISRQRHYRCLKCNKEEMRPSVVLAVALQYGGEGEGAGEGQRTLCDVIRGSLTARRTGPAWCDSCQRFTATQQIARVVRLPPLLAINCGTSDGDRGLWRTGGQGNNAADVSPRLKPCRYGLSCARPGCRFTHPDRVSPSGTATSSLPAVLAISLRPDGDLVITDKSSSPPEASGPGGAPTHVYRLTGSVSCVGGHLVASVGGDAGGWWIINDVTAVEVSQEEVTSVCPWKTPCVLLYSAAAH